jgi:hypothetical protein
MSGLQVHGMHTELCLVAFGYAPYSDAVRHPALIFLPAALYVLDVPWRDFLEVPGVGGKLRNRGHAGESPGTDSGIPGGPGAVKERQGKDCSHSVCSCSTALGQAHTQASCTTTVQCMAHDLPGAACLQQAPSSLPQLLLSHRLGLCKCSSQAPTQARTTAPSRTTAGARRRVPRRPPTWRPRGSATQGGGQRRALQHTPRHAACCPLRSRAGSQAGRSM